MQQLTYTTKLKLLVPFTYLLASNILFVIFFDGSVHQIIGIVVADTSFLLWITARIQLGNAFSIAPQSKFIVKSGLYSKLRHPVYYFSVTAVIGISIFIGSSYTVPVILALILLEVIRIQKEEALLSETFGKEYATYKQQTWF